MAVLSNSPYLADKLTNCLRNSLQFFFNDTSGRDRQYLTMAVIDFVDQMRDIETKRIRRTDLNARAAMSLIRHVGKIMSHLPEAITQTLQSITFNPEAPPRRFMPDDEAENEVEEEELAVDQTPGLPASGTPPDPPPERNSRESSTSAFNTGRVQEAVQRIEGPQLCSIPATKWQGWKTQPGPTIADVEQSRMSPPGDQDADLPDPQLREAMVRSLQETRHDPNETPNTGGASGSASATAQSHYQGATPTGTPNTQSDGEGSLIPNRPPSIATGTEANQFATLRPGPMSIATQSMILEDRISREKAKINQLVAKMTAVDQVFTEVDFNDLNALKQSVVACQRTIDSMKSQQPTEPVATPRPQVLQSNIIQDDQEFTAPDVRKPSRSRPRSQRAVRGRSKADKRRRHPDSGDHRSVTRPRQDPMTVMPAVTIPRPTVASIFLQGAEDLSSSCLTSQEPAQTVPQIVQSAGAGLPNTGMANPSPQRGIAIAQSGPPRDPRSQSERRRVVIETPQENTIGESQQPGMFAGRPFQLRSNSAEPQLPSGDYEILESSQDPGQQGRSTFYR